MVLALPALLALCPGTSYPAQTASGTRLAKAVALPAPRNMAPDSPGSDVRQLLLDVEAHQKRAESLQREYTYHVHTEEEDLDGQGRVRKTTVIDAESLTLQGVRVNRVTARNGKPLTPDEQHKEDERIDKQVERRTREREKLQAKGADTDSNGNALLPASRILELGVFTNPRREVLDGRPTVVLTYAGDPHAKTRNTFESVVRDLTGTVWIDEAERVLVRAEGEFRDDFKIGGGLVANIHKGTQFHFKAARLADTVWLPAVVDARGSARFLLVDGVNGHVHLVTSDYRRFRSSAVISSPGNVLGPDDLPVQPISAQRQDPAQHPPE